MLFIEKQNSKGRSSLECQKQEVSVLLLLDVQVETPLSHDGYLTWKITSTKCLRVERFFQDLSQIWTLLAMLLFPLESLPWFIRLSQSSPFQLISLCVIPFYSFVLVTVAFPLVSFRFLLKCYSFRGPFFGQFAKVAPFSSCSLSFHFDLLFFIVFIFSMYACTCMHAFIDLSQFQNLICPMLQI